MYFSSFAHKTDKLDVAVNFKCNYADADELSYDKARTEELCKSCGMYGRCYSCPPRSPSFGRYVSKYKYAFVYCFFINSDEIKIKNPYFRSMTANRILAPMLYRFGISIEALLDGLSFRSGYCHLCRPCRAKLGKPCAHPDKMRYSLESVGVDVSKCSGDVLGHKIDWSKKGTIPKYYSVVGAVLTNKHPDERGLFEAFSRS